jgi:predicted metal-binding membrane protein
MSVAEPPPGQLERTSVLARSKPVGIATVLLAGALAAWIVTVGRMQGMDAGPGTDLGAVGWYLGIWVTMMAAMMLPSVAPMVLVFAGMSRGRGKPRSTPFRTSAFLSGYFIAWTAYGLVAYGVFRLVDAADLGFLAWDRAGAAIAGGAVAAAGIYQLTPLKELCLRHCRGPLHFILHGWRDGRLGALRMGGEHGLYCVGCCWGLMVILFALGVMSLLWMAAVAAVIFAEKVLPYGLRLSRVFAVAFIAFGIWVAIAPSTVPGLTEPGDSGMTQMNQMNSP